MVLLLIQKRPSQMGFWESGRAPANHQRSEANLLQSARLAFDRHQHLLPIILQLIQQFFQELQQYRHQKDVQQQMLDIKIQARVDVKEEKKKKKRQSGSATME